MKWHKVVLMKALLDDHASITDKTPATGEQKDAWLLAISVKGKHKDKIGRSYSVQRRFDIEEGDIYLEYEVVEAPPRLA